MKGPYGNSWYANSCSTDLLLVAPSRYLQEVVLGSCMNEERKSEA